MNPQFWDERYAAHDLVYGDAPNEFLAAVVEQIPAGPVLTLGEGEGRNALLLARGGHDVLAVDQSAVGLAKARRRAELAGLTIATQVADLAAFPIQPGGWAGIVSVFCHLPPQIRVPLHAAIVRGLQPRGVFVLEAYTPAQLGRGTGGPSDAAMMPTLAELRRELAGLEFLHATELDREVHEGACHTGLAAVVQVVARRPGVG